MVVPERIFRIYTFHIDKIEPLTTLVLDPNGSGIKTLVVLDSNGSGTKTLVLLDWTGSGVTMLVVDEVVSG